MLNQLMALKSATISLTANSDDTYNVIVSSPNTSMFSARFQEWQTDTIEALIINHINSVSGGAATGLHSEGNNSTTATAAHTELPSEPTNSTSTDANTIASNF